MVLQYWYRVQASQWQESWSYQPVLPKRFVLAQRHSCWLFMSLQALRGSKSGIGTDNEAQQALLSKHNRHCGLSITGTVDREKT